MRSILVAWLPVDFAIDRGGQCTRRLKDICKDIDGRLEVVGACDLCPLRLSVMVMPRQNSI